MNRPDRGIEVRITDWISATKGRYKSVPRSQAVRAGVAELRSELLSGSNCSRIERTDALNMLSVLSYQLVSESEPSVDSLRLAEQSFEALSSSNLEADEFGEAAELLCRFAFVAWRHARALCQARRSQRWIEQVDQIVATRYSVSRECLEYFCGIPVGERSAELDASFLADPEILFFLCSILREERNTLPQKALDTARAAFDWVDRNFHPTGFEDERLYFLSHMASTISTSLRWLGARDESDRWLCRCEEFNRNIRGAELGQAWIDLTRMIVAHEMGSQREVIEQLGSVRLRLESLGMETLLVSADLLLAAHLRGVGEVERSLEPLRRSLNSPVLRGKPLLRAFTLLSLSDSYALSELIEQSDQCFESASSILSQSEGSSIVAWMNLVAGERFRLQAEPLATLQAYRAARRAYEYYGMQTGAAYARLLTADILLGLGRDREAEREIVAALPAIESARLLVEGVAAIRLLRESIRRQKVDATSLRYLATCLRGLQK